jgi:hypothetical protein
MSTEPKKIRYSNLLKLEHYTPTPFEQYMIGIEYLEEKLIPLATGKERDLLERLITKLRDEAEQCKNWRHPWIRGHRNF